MTALIINKPKWKFALGVTSLIFLCCFLITLTAKFKNNIALLSNGILVDLLVIAPFIYFLIIRKTAVPKLTTLRVFIVGVFMAGLILNANKNVYLHITKTFVCPVIEAVVIIFISRKFYIANKTARLLNKGKPDFLFHCRQIMLQVVCNEKAANMLSSEIAVFYYTFFSKKDKAIDYKIKFSSYKENGVLLVLGVILSICLIETTAMHFLLMLWNDTVAWILTGLSLYTCMQLYAHIKAVKARPVAINNNTLEIHNGLAGDATITFNNIEKIELSNKFPVNCNAVKLSLLKGIENHNIIVYLNEPVIVTKMFGIKKQADAVLFFVDKPQDFLASLIK